MKTLPLFLALLSIIAIAGPQLPEPYCKVRPSYTTLPLTIGQILSHNMGSFATGYNLDFAVKVGSQFATIPQKLQLRDTLKHPFQRLVGFQIQHKGNGWANHSHFLVREGDFTYLYTGLIKQGDKVPVLDNPIIVEISSNIVCYDSVIFPDHGVAIVDCAYISGKQPGFGTVTNKYLYVDLAKQQTIKQVENDMFVPFANITNRKMMRYHDPLTGYEYVLRAYLAGGVDLAHANNTYLQFISAYDPYDLQVIRVIDRSYLQLSTLSLTDLKIYLGDIFFLDYLNGLFRLDIGSGQQVTITGRYIADGFTRMSVYSDDLDQQVLIALANSHSVHQVDWNNPRRPFLITKYSLIEHSHIVDISVNQKYLIVQANSNITTPDSVNTTINYTWIFSKGARTYHNAFKIISHNCSTVFIDVNSDTQSIIIASQNGLYNYKINDPILRLQQSDSSVLNRSATLLVEATSSDPFSKAIKICSTRSTVYYVQPDNTTMWTTGISVTEEYYANYPGSLQIPLGDYLVGPNITYWVNKVNSTDELPESYINQQNQTKVLWWDDQPPAPGQINFFHSDVVPHYGNDTVIYYFQDSTNTTTVASCFNQWDTATLHCSSSRKYSHRTKIYRFMSSIFKRTNQGFNEYFYAFTLEGAKNIITVVDYIRHLRIAEISLPEGFQGEVGSLASSNGYLYVLLPKIKTINVYRLQNCQEFQCPVAFVIDSNHLKPLGVGYFAPQQLITTRQHPEVLFIRCLGQVIILDIDNNMNLVLLSQIFSPATQQLKYKLICNLQSLVLVASPNIIQHYDLRQIYFTKNVVMTRTLNLYWYIIPQDFDIQFSDIGDLFYVNAYDTKGNFTTVLIFRTGIFAVASLYDVINLPKTYTKASLQIEVSGQYVDFVSIIAGGNFSLFRQFQKPSLVLIDTFNDFQFQIQFDNSGVKKNLTKVAVHIANYPQGFKPTPQFQKIKPTLKIQSQPITSWDTRKWFTGQILRYNHTCDDCSNGKIRVHNHISYMRRINASGYDYSQTIGGGVLLWDDLIRLYTNGSVRQVMLLPDQKMDEGCIRVSPRRDETLIYTGCQVFGQGVNIYITSLAGSKPFTWGPYRSSSAYLRNLQLVHNILMVVDVDYYSERMYRPGGVYLYATDIDPLSERQLQQLDLIDTNDFLQAHGWDEDDAYIGNAHLVYDQLDDAYRLYLTEVRYGLFVIDFKYVPGSRTIQVITTNYIDVVKLLKDNNLNMPNGATFMGVTLVGARYNPALETESVVITTRGYHNFELYISYDQTGHILGTILHRVYYRYTVYQSDNYVRAQNGFLAVSYTLPYVFDWTQWTKQLIVLYDTNDYSGESEKGYSQRYMLAAHTINHTDHAFFNFNTTFNRQHNTTRAGLVVIDRKTNSLSQLNISRNLSVEIVDSSIQSQVITLRPYNDFAKYEFKIQVLNPHPNPEPDNQLGLSLQIVLIVVSILVFLGLLGYLIYVCIRKPLTDKEKQLIQDPPAYVRPQPSNTLIEPILNESVRQSQQENEVVAPYRYESDGVASVGGDSVVDAPKASEELPSVQEAVVAGNRPHGAPDV